MGSKKQRSREEKREKFETQQAIKEEKQKSTTRRKTKALLNMGAILSILLLIFLGNAMNSTINVEYSEKASNALLDKELGLKDASSFGSAEASDAVFVGYTLDGKVGIAEADRHKFLYNRYAFTTDLKTTSEKATCITHNVKAEDKSYVVIYGDLTDTLASYAEVTFNGETQKVDLKTRDKFIQAVSFKYADLDKAEIKVFDKDGKLL